MEEIEIDEGIDAATDEDGDEDTDSDIEATQRENAELQQRIHTRETRERVSVIVTCDIAKYSKRMNQTSLNRSNYLISWYLLAINILTTQCHRRLEIQFGDQINFIIGHNGSGKSAILTALTICLGGKATATNRGSSLKNLIKEGEKYIPLSYSS